MTDLVQATAALVTATGELVGTKAELLDWSVGRSDGGPNGDGNYPFTAADGTVILVPSIPKLKAYALGGDNADTLAEILGTTNSKLALVDTATAQANTARDAAATQAGYAGQQGDYAKQQALLIGDIGGAVATATSARTDALAAAVSVNTARLGLGERLREVLPSVGLSAGATQITTAGVPSGLVIPNGSSGVSSYVRAALPIPPEIAARFAGTTIRLKAAFTASAGLLTEKPIATGASQIGSASFTDGTSTSAGFTQQALGQSGNVVTREISYLLTGLETQIALIAQVGTSTTTNPHSLELKSLSLAVDAVPAGAEFTGADVVAAWRAYEQRIGIGPIFADSSGLSVTQANGGTSLSVGGRVLGITTAAGSTGQTAAAGIIIPMPATAAPLLAGKTARVRLALLTSAAFTRTLSVTLRARYAIQFDATISGNILTLASQAVNAVTGAPVAIPAGTQGIVLNGINGAIGFYLSGLATGVSGAKGSTYTLQNAQTGYGLPTTFTIFAYRFFTCAVEVDAKLSPTRRMLTIAALPNQPFVGDELFIEPYAAQTSTSVTASTESWQIEDASLSLNTVALGTVGGPAEHAQNIAYYRGAAMARSLAAADAQASYFFGSGDTLSQTANADQANTGTGGATIAGNTISIPANTSGRNAIFQRRYSFSGASNAGKRIRLRVVLSTSAVWTRTIAAQLQVRTAAGDQIRTATITQTVSGTTIIYSLDYTVQGDETMLAPYVIVQNTDVAAQAESLTLVAIPLYFLTGSPGFSPADENIAQGQAAIFAQVAALIASAGNYAVTKTVKADGTGDFLHPKLALDAISDATAAKRYNLLIYPGVYDGYAEWHTKDWIDLTGVGRAGDVVIQYALPNDAPAATITNTSTLWWDTITNLRNLTVTARNMRYAIHQETNGQRLGLTQSADNCIFIHYGNDAAVNNTWQPGSQAAVGTGSSDGMTAIHINCQFTGPGVTGYHQPNRGTRTRPIKFRWENCTMTCTKAGQPAMVFSVLAQGAGDTAELVGCTINGPVWLTDTAWLNTADTTTNRAQIAIYGHSNTAFTFVNKITAAPGGDYQPQLTGR